jgi:hypothetical protein
VCRQFERRIAPIRRRSVLFPRPLRAAGAFKARLSYVASGASELRIAVRLRSSRLLRLKRYPAVRVRPLEHRETSSTSATARRSQRLHHRPRRHPGNSTGLHSSAACRTAVRVSLSEAGSDRFSRTPALLDAAKPRDSHPSRARLVSNNIVAAEHHNTRGRNTAVVDAGRAGPLRIIRLGRRLRCLRPPVHRRLRWQGSRSPTEPPERPQSLGWKRSGAL